MGILLVHPFIGGIYGDVCCCMRNIMCRFYAAQAVRAFLFFLSLCLLYTLYSTFIVFKDNPRWTEFPTVCDPIQKYSCARLSASNNKTIMDCETCLYRTEAISQRVSIDFKNTIGSVGLLSAAKSCIPGFFHEQRRDNDFLFGNSEYSFTGIVDDVAISLFDCENYNSNPLFSVFVQF